MKLENPRHESFCQEYIKDFNGYRAYKAVYGDKESESTLCAGASRLLRNGKVTERWKHLALKAAKRNNVLVDDIIQEYKKIAFLKLSDVYDFDGVYLKCKSFDEIPEEALSAIESVETVKGDEDTTVLKIKFHSKTKALDSLARTRGMFLDRSAEQNTKETYEQFLERVMGKQ